MARFALAFSIGLLLSGCSGDDDPEVGTERGPCYPNNTCNAGLTCYSGICVRTHDGALPDAPSDSSQNDGPSADTTSGPGTVSTLAGGGSPGHVDGPVQSARFAAPSGVAVDASGAIYVADRDNHCIRKIEGGVVSTLAGDTTAGFLDGPAASARFFAPTGVVVDLKDVIFVADAGNHRIRQITAGTVSTYAGTGSPGLKDGPRLSAQFNSPRDIAASKLGELYVADHESDRVRKIGSNGTVDTLSAKTGSGANWSAVYGATGVAVDTMGGVFVVEQRKHRVLRVYGGTVSTFAGMYEVQGSTDGPAAAATFRTPSDVVVDVVGNAFVADLGNHRVRWVSAGQVDTAAGSSQGYQDGLAAKAKFNGPYSLALDSSGRVIIADVNNNCIRLLSP